MLAKVLEFRDLNFMIFRIVPAQEKPLSASASPVTAVPPKDEEELPVLKYSPSPRISPGPAALKSPRPSPVETGIPRTLKPVVEDKLRFAPDTQILKSNFDLGRRPGDREHRYVPRIKPPPL